MISRTVIGFCIALLTLVGACGSGAASTKADSAVDEGAVPEGWQVELDSLKFEDAHYAYSYANDQPEGRRLHVELGKVVRGCGLDEHDPTTIEWKLTLLLGSKRAKYPIDPHLGDRPGIHARAILTALKGEDEIRQYEAIGGTILLRDAAATLNEWHAGDSADVDFELHFSRKPKHQLGCSDGIDRTTGERTVSCLCEDERGVKSECVPKGAEQSCCLEASDDLYMFTGKASAIPCPALCSWDGQASLQTLCEELKP